MRTKGRRETDPDVIALKALARALLDGIPTPRYEGDTHEQPVRPGETPDPWPLDPTAGEGLVDKLVQAVFVATQEAPESTFTCSIVTTPTFKDSQFSVEQKQVCTATEPSVPKEQNAYKKTTVDREALRAALTDRDLLQRIFDADPNEGELKAYDNNRHLLTAGSRSLKCSSCVNADSYVCAYCWEQEFCASRFYWCA